MIVKEKIAPVLIKITLALFVGRSIVAHITRCRLYTTPHNQRRNQIPMDLDLVEVVDEEGE